MGCGNSSTRRVYPVQHQPPSESSGVQQPPPPPPVTTVSKATQTPPLLPENEDNISDDGSHELDKVILVQSLEQESVGKEDQGGETEEQKQSKKDDDEAKVEPIVQTEGDDIETFRIDEKEAKPTQDLKTDSDDDREAEVKSKEIKEKEKDTQPLVVVEKVPVQDPSPVSIPGSKKEKETSAVEDSEIVGKDDKKEDDKPPQVDKPDELIPPESLNDNDTEDPSSQDLNMSRSSQHTSDPTAMPSHPLKPLPNIDDGITETKSEPRLPLLPPIGSKKIATLQSPLKSPSASGILLSTDAQSKGSTEKGKERESTPLMSNQATARKKKSTDSLRSTSGSSISKSKKSSSSSSSNSKVSLGPKSKSRESLRSGPKDRLSTASKSSDNLANGAAKKLSISRDSLKAASQVYSSAPGTKSGELPKKGDSGKSQSSKSKEAVKAEKEIKSSGQKPPDKLEVPTGASSKAKEEVSESGTSDKNSSGNDSNQDITAKKEQDLDVNNKTTSPTSVEEQTKNEPSTKKEEINEVAVTSDQTAVDSSHKEDKSIKGEEEAGGDAQENGEAKEVENEASSESNKAEPPPTSDNVTERKQEKAQNISELSPPANPAEESDAKTEGTKQNNEVPSPSISAKVEVKFEGRKVTEGTSDNTKPQEGEKGVIHESQTKELPAAGTGHGPGDDTVSQISSEFANKLEIDKKTGQSEQSIVEAVEKSTEPITTTRDISTPA